MKSRPSQVSFFALLLFALPLSAQQWDTLAEIPANFTFPVVDTLNGKIHIMGGGGAGGATNLHYAYDPETNQWTQKASIPYVAQQPAGAAAAGKIHFFGGGFPNSGSPVDDHYIYDPGMDNWTQAADLTTPRAIHYAASLGGVVYTLAGQGVTTLCEAYDPLGDEWVQKNNLPDGQFWYGAHVTAGDHIYRFCGGGFMGPNNNAHRYHSDMDSWETLPNFPAATHGIAGAAIGDKIYLGGGYHTFAERDEVWIFDTETEEYTPGTPLPLARNYHNMVALDSCIYVVGGHHAIFPEVRTQLLRYCPYATSSTKDLPVVSNKLRSYYLDGHLYMFLDGTLNGDAELQLFDVSGRFVANRNIQQNAMTRLDAEVGQLPPGIYFLTLRSERIVYSGKISIH